MNIEGGFHNNTESEDRPDEQPERRRQLKQEMDTVLRKLQGFEEWQTKIAAKIRKLKRDKEQAGPEAKEDIKEEVHKIINDIKVMKVKRKEAEEKLEKLEASYKELVSVDEQER